MLWPASAHRILGSTIRVEDLEVVAGGGNHGGVEELGNLDSSNADAGACRQNQDRIARLDGTAAHQHVPCRRENQGNAGRLLEGKLHTFRNRNYADAGDGDVFAIAAVIGITQDAEVGAKVLASGDAFDAVSAEGHGSQEHTLSYRQVGNVLAQFGDFSGDVTAVDMRQLDAGEPFADEQIEVVERACLHSNQNLVFAKLGLSDILVLQDLRPAELVEACGFHFVRVTPE